MIFLVIRKSGVSQSLETKVFITDIVGQNELFTGGIHGPDGSIFVTGIILLGFLYVHFFVKKPCANVWTMDSDLPLIRDKKVKTVA